MRTPGHRALRRTWPVALALVTMLAAPPGRAQAVAPPAPVHGLDPGIAHTAAAPVSVIVTGAPDVGTLVEQHGGTVTATLPLVQGVAAAVPASHIEALAREHGVVSITADRTARLSDMSYDASTTASNFTRTTQATAAWARGDVGQGVGVAVLDTGVSPMPDFGDRLVHGPDLSGEGTTIDTYGHGTVMAGIIGGGGNDSEDRAGGAYTGVAPGANIVAVKVAGANGVVDVSTILQAMSWIAAYKNQFDIKVMNLSWGVASTQDPTIDPLNYAVERLWSNGIVVVVAAGNSGPYKSTVTKPGDDPLVLTVGAYNDRNDTYSGNDIMNGWSSRGPTATGLQKPDLVAPGRTLIATRSYGSTVETGNPTALVAPSYIRGSGTSQAAAVVSGLVALLLQARPDLTPDEVKDVLTATAQPIQGASHSAQGAGRVQVSDAWGATPSAPPQPAVATGLGSIEASRAGTDVVADCDGVSTEITGEVDVRCQPWDPQAWTTAPWNGEAWTGAQWTGVEPASGWWRDAAWSDASWDGANWTGGNWTGGSWEGTTGWDGSSSGAWTGVRWRDSTWTGVRWRDTNWTSNRFTTADFGDDDFLTAFWGARPKAGRHVAGEAYTPTRAEVLRARYKD